MKSNMFGLASVIIIFLLLSCGTTRDIVLSPEIDLLPFASTEDDREITITVDNPTGYDVFIEGNIEKRIEKLSNNNTLTLLIEDGPLSSGFYIFYEIPLSNSVFLFYKGDHKVFRENQTSFTIEEPHHIENYGTFIILRNKVNNAVRFFTGGTSNSSWIQTGSPKMGNNWTRTSKMEFNPNETAIFKIDYNSGHKNYFVRDGRNNNPLILPQNVKNNFVYDFDYTANGVTLTDARPLHRVSEESWLKPIDVTGTEPIQLVEAENKEAIHIIVSTDGGLLRNTYNSTGNIIDSRPTRESIPYFTSAGLAEGGFFIAGYERLANGIYRPIVRLQSMNGSTQDILNQSGNYISRIFTTAQKGNDEWLLAGDGAKIGTYGNTAYVRLVRLENNKLKPEWERGSDDFKGKSVTIECGTIKSAVYDHVHDCWFVTGENINQDDSYVAQISSDGKITVKDFFKDKTFNKILIDANGICYLAGDEQRGNETYAILIKYTINNNHTQQITTQAASHSYYYDALMDTANNQIVLAGVLKAEDDTGYRGIPFIEAIDLQSGDLRWREELANPEIKDAGAVLVTAIVPAPDYGFVIALSGIANDSFGKPFIIARVNSQGKYIRRVRQ